jgi:ribosomal protein S18 acetylase RimI-like enzyme
MIAAAPGSGGVAAPHVRFATPADLDFTVHTTYVSAARMRQLVEQGQVAVAEVAGERVGYAALDWLVVMAPFLGVIWVHPAHRRRGVGTALLEFLEDTLRERGFAVLYSSCVVTEVEPQAWHRRRGFRECGLIAEFNDDGSGEVLLRKPLVAGRS